MKDKKKLRKTFVIFAILISISVLTYISLTAPETGRGYIDSLGNFAANSKVGTILITLGLVCLVLEILLPGFTFLGVIGITSIVMFFLGTIYAGNATIFSLIMTVVGAILIGIEVVVPGFGLPGISGIIFIMIGFSTSMNSFSDGITAVLISFFVTLITIYLVIKLGIETRTFEIFRLLNQVSDNTGTSVDASIGDIGITNSVLRPSGYVIIDNKLYDAKSVGSFIDKDKTVEVVSKKGNEIIVREVSNGV